MQHGVLWSPPKETKDDVVCLFAISWHVFSFLRAFACAMCFPAIDDTIVREINSLMLSRLDKARLVCCSNDGTGLDLYCATTERMVLA